MAEETKNLWQKLIEVRKSCQYLKKDNQGHQFKYVSSSQTLGTLRTAMDEHGLLLVPRVTAHETRDHATKNGGHEYFTIASISFTWINADKPEEVIDCPWLGHGLDSGEKGVGKAMTYAEKYFLLKFFNIATDKDDPDSFQKKNDKKAAAATAKNNQKAAAGADSLKAGNIAGWMAAATAEIMAGRDADKYWTEYREKIIEDCGADGAKEVHAKVIA